MASVYELPDEDHFAEQSINPPDSRTFFDRTQEYKFAISREMNAFKDYLEKMKLIDFSAYKEAANRYNELTDRFDSILGDAARNTGMSERETHVVLNNLESVFQEVRKIMSDVSPEGSIMHDPSLAANPASMAMVSHSDIIDVKHTSGGIRGYVSGMNPVLKKVLVAAAIAGSVFAGKKVYNRVVKKKFVEKEGTEYEDGQDLDDDQD